MWLHISGCRTPSPTSSFAIATSCRGVRFQGDNWQARTKRNSRELSLGLYNTAEEAVSGWEGVTVGERAVCGWAVMV